MRELLAIIACSVVIGTGCSRDPYESGPSETEVRDRLATEFPAWIEIRALDLRATENVGDRVQPVFKIRFEGEIQLREDTFAESGREADAILIAPVMKSGDKRKLYGTAMAVYKGGTWQMQFQFDANPLADIGKPRSLITGGPTVLRGSSEEDTFREQRTRETATATAQEEARVRDASNRLQRLLSQQNAIWTGAAWDQRGRWPQRIRVTSFDPGSGKFTGEVEIPSLNAIHRLEGTLVGSKVVYRGVEYIRRGKAFLDCVYELELQGERRLVGTWGKCSESVGTGQAELVIQ